MLEQAVILTEPAAPAGSGETDGPVDAGRYGPGRVLLGLSLLQRMIMTLGYGGIKRILVLAPEGGERFDDLASGTKAWLRYGTDVRLAAAGDAELPMPEAPFLLLGGMVVFDAALAQHLHRCEVESDRLLVPEVNGRSLSRFSGLALCRAASFRRLVAEAGGAPCDRGLGAFLASASPLVVEGHGWVKVDSREGEKQARRLLRLSMGKPSDGFFSRHVNRRFSWPISRLLIRLGVKPNHVTLANLALGLFSAWLIGRGGYGSTLAAGLLFQFVSIVDGCDGEIARLTFRFSALGARLDNLCDIVVLVAFFLSLPIGLYAATRDASYLTLGGLMALLVAVFYLLLLARIRLMGFHGNIAEMARRVQERGKGGEALGWLERLGTRLGFIFRKEFISLYAMVWCLLGRAEGLLWTIVGLTPLGIVYQLDSIRRLHSRRPDRA